MPAILRQVDSIILEGIVADSESVGINFNPSQLEEEKIKLEWTKKNSDKAEKLFALEDHPLLYGQISIVCLECTEHFERFESLFSCDWDLIDCALFTIGDYKQKDSSKRGRYQLGSSMSNGFAWKTLFHKSESFLGFENTKKVLNELLERTQNITNDFLKEMIDNFLEGCETKNEYPWIYYYIKYKEFRTGRYGRYCWDDFDKSPYVLTTLFQQKELSENSYNPFLKAVNDSVWRENYGRLIYLNEKESLKETQTSYQMISNDENEYVLKEFTIYQNNGIDTENRIEKMRREFPSISNSKSVSANPL
jgi:hypothetical protein